MKLLTFLLAGIAGACAIPREVDGAPGRTSRLPVVVIADGVPQQHELRFEDVRAGQVVVAGIWTVIFAVDEADMTWIRGLAAQHDSVALEWEGREVWTFGESPGSDGYFIDRGFSDEVTARRVADEIRSRQSANDE